MMPSPPALDTAAACVRQEQREKRTRSVRNVIQTKILEQKKKYRHYHFSVAHVVHATLDNWMFYATHFCQFCSKKCHVWKRKLKK